MFAAAAPHRILDVYLAELRSRLHALPKDEVEDIVQEIHSHVLDTAGPDTANDARIHAVLNRLGPASSLAASYVTDNLLARAQHNRMPWTIVRAIFHWAMLSVKGFLVLMVCIPGYLFGASFFVAALAKPFNRRVGLWLINKDTYSLVLGMTNSIPPGHELLGWKLIPLGFALGGGTILLTTHFAHWCIREFRESKSVTGRIQ